MMKKASLYLISYIILMLAANMSAQNYERPPGTIINYISAKTGKYIGSPSICVLANGDYLASHDEFGPKSSEYKSAQTLVFRSADKGRSWTKVSQINGQFWANLFVIGTDLYIMGTNKAHGNVVIRKSADNGQTWSNPYLPDNGLILEGEYHTAPTPIAVHNGRIWRAVEYATGKSDRWPRRYSAVMLSAPVASDILDARNWTRSNSLAFDSTNIDKGFEGWFEGNAIVDKDGRIADLLRVHTPNASNEYTAILKASEDGTHLSADTDNVFFKMPGASKKFTVRYDPQSAKYISLVNYIPDEYKAKANTDRIRNFVALISSDDLRNWQVNKIILSHPDHLKHGFQYMDWCIENDDIIFIARTAYDDADGGASDYHNANYLTFHRINQFRNVLKNCISTN